MDVKRIQAALLTVPGVQPLMPSGADGFWGSETERALAFVVAKAGGMTEAPPVTETLPDGYLALLSRIESGDRPYVKAATSSASGLYQFIKSTWLGEGGAWGPNKGLAFGGLRPTKAEQDRRATTFTLKNVRALIKAGIPVNRASLYACHFLGAGTAIPMIAADVKQDAGAIAGYEATKANPSILKGKTVGQFLTWLHKKTGDWAR